MQPITQGTTTARLADTPALMAQVMGLRAAAFRGGAADGDDWDALCEHVLIARGDQALAAFRLRRLLPGDLDYSYTGARYDLGPLARLPGPVAELGRFCTAAPDPDAIRLSWAAVTALCDLWRASHLIGCTSFPGTDPAPWGEPLSLLRAHLAPPAWAPRPRSGAMPLPDLPASPQALTRLPPLLRSYLALGGKVSDHLVIDPDLNTFHLFTGLDLATIPPARAATLRALANG